MTIKMYANKQNPYKIIEVKHYNDGHYLWRQKYAWPNGVTNFYGRPKGGFSRMRKRCIYEVLNDDYNYLELFTEVR